ncbi:MULTISPECIES: N,N-dimethylformamidase beta subunit family domain-containing protein [unclassified Kitasatospora]|uniref:N,N-dimethylformamidase beta subunit family domain-containing protein n=1 Tax=unclassified Kitasatospora TaxID=2633591 RepID=UPI0024757426|nr:N,N-dimethylformamidase beta subunit family domain-containing protein [Kitasatospora sp. MAP12-44]
MPVPWRIILPLVAASLVAGCTGAPAPTATPTPEAGAPDWAIADPGPTDAIQGYADRAGVLPGVPVRLMVSTTASAFQVRAYRFGAYAGGLPARLVWSSPQTPGRSQPAPTTDARGMTVAPWQPSVTVPTDGWPPGSYLLRLDAASGGKRWVPLTVESPSVAGRVVLVQPVTSYQAYNTWGGRNLYVGPDGAFATRARAVSFDRPYQDEDGAADFFRLEQPLVAFAERQGLPLAYRTSVDLDLDPHALDGAAAVLSEGHDEYWSPAMRATVTHARDAGSNLAFLGANAVYRRIRFESAASGPDRVEVNYKVPQEDPLYGKDNSRVTGDWPSPPDADPQSSLTGQAYACDAHTNAPLLVENPGSLPWAGTGVTAGQQLTGLVGPESDHLDTTSGRAPQVTVLGHADVACAFGPPTTANTTSYTAASGATVFDAGTENWICALRTDDCPGVPADVRRIVQAATGQLLKAFAQHGQHGQHGQHRPGG